MTQPKLFDDGDIRRSSSMENAYISTLRDIIDNGIENTSMDPNSVGKNKKSFEIINYSQIVSKPRNRLMTGGARKINFPAAVARFVWMMAGSDRLSDIAFYESKVGGFTDDGISIPGSSYGQRILRPTPGINQLKSVIARLKSDPNSRRAAIAIYQAEDSARESADIPCTFGLFYGIRKDQLISSTIMRSNNAFILLPYNMFEFSLLAEVIASELGIGLGHHYHYAFSMHVYEENIDIAKKIIASVPGKHTSEMEVMPKGEEQWEKPVEQIRRLVILESIMRHRIAGVNLSNIVNLLDVSSTKVDPLMVGSLRKDLKLNDYWSQLYYLLIMHALLNNTSHFRIDKRDEKSIYVGTDEGVEIFDKISSLLIERYRDATGFIIKGEETTDMPDEIELPQISDSSLIMSHDSPMNKAITDAITEYEINTGKTVSWKKLSMFQEEFLPSIAARDEGNIKDIVLKRLLSDE